MTVYLDADVTGVGQSGLAGGNSVIFISVDIGTTGSQSSRLEPDVADHFLRLGWFALGDSFDAGPGVADHWREIVWCNFTENLWTPTPDTVGGSPQTTLATLIRWWFGPGVSAHLHVFGL